MTAATAAAIIGKTGILTVEDRSLAIVVTILDARSAYGRTDYLVTPKDGAGQKWVAADRIQLESPLGVAKRSR